MNRHERRVQKKRDDAHKAPPSRTVTPEQAVQIALSHHQAGRHEVAEQLYRQVLDVMPDNATARHFLGLSLQQQGQVDEGIELMVEAVTMDPAPFAFHSNLGNAYLSTGRVDEAVRCFERALARNASVPELHHNLGTALSRRGEPVRAEAAYRKAIALRPEYAESHSGLVALMLAEGRFAEAEELAKRGLELAPRYAPLANNLANAIASQGRREDALAAYRSATTIDPNYAEAHNNLGNAERELFHFDSALLSYRRALALAPNLAAARNNLATTLHQMGRVGEALGEYERALQADPSFARAWSNKLLASQSTTDRGREAVFADHVAFGKRIEEAVQVISPRMLDKDPERRLRIAYLSPDLRQHAVAQFLEGVLSAHDRSRFDVSAYFTHATEDGTTRRLEAHLDVLHRAFALSEQALAEKIREDKIDILVDLAGHSSDARLGVLARRPAPIQMTWIGYPDTTGLSRVDYRIVDEHTDPPGAEAFATEKLLRVPAPFLCFHPPADAPEVAMPERTALNIGTWNAMHKVSLDMLELWTEILHAVPHARLILKSAAYGTASTRMRVTGILERAGIEPDRYELRPWIASEQGHLAAYGDLDIALDTFPYAGTTTTCEALWMGVPVVTLEGDRHASRVGGTILRAVGLGELVTTGREAYRDAVVSLASDRDRLRALRAELRQRVSASPLCDNGAAARKLEEAFRQAWRDYCARATGKPS